MKLESARGPPAPPPMPSRPSSYPNNRKLSQKPPLRNQSLVALFRPTAGKARDVGNAPKTFLTFASHRHPAAKPAHPFSEYPFGEKPSPGPSNASEFATPGTAAGQFANNLPLMNPRAPPVESPPLPPPITDWRTSKTPRTSLKGPIPSIPPRPSPHAPGQPSPPLSFFFVA